MRWIPTADALNPQLSAPTVDRARLRTNYRPWYTERTTRYRLRCGDTPLELTFLGVLAIPLRSRATF